MHIKFVSEPKAEAVGVAASEGAGLGKAGQSYDARTSGALAKAMNLARMTGATGQICDLIAPQGADCDRLLAAGLGPLDRVEPAHFERWAGAIVQKVLTSGLQTLALFPESATGVSAAEAAARAAMGAQLASYRFDLYRKNLKPNDRVSLTEVQIVCDGAAAAQARFADLAAVADGVNLARDLVNEPPNVLYPEEFANRIKKLTELGVEVEILGEAEMKKLGMSALLMVGHGSARESKLAVMAWRGARNNATAPLAVVGKGVCFDSGGVSLKPGPNMDEMKGDMAGAAAVVGLMRTLAQRKAKANVVGVVALVENMPDGQAQRPGDIVTSMADKTIEVLNTDAEGRLILCDAVWFAQEKFNPAAVIDLATLTGAIVIALGTEHAGLFANNDELAQAVVQAGLGEREPVWRLPLGPAYDKLIDSSVADMKNIASKPGAGSIVGAQFIGRFIKDGMPWAHLDIAGVAWKSPPYEDPLSPSWATGYGVRLLNRLVGDRYEE